MPRPDQQMGPGSGIRAPQGDSGEPPVHDHEHARGGAASLIASSGSPQQTPSTAASICAWVPVSVSVTTLTWGNPATCPRASLRPAEPPPVRLRLRSIQDEAVHGGEPHPTVERARQASRGQRPGQLAEDRLDGLRSQALASPG